MMARTERWRAATEAPDAHSALRAFAECATELRYAPDAQTADALTWVCGSRELRVLPRAADGDSVRLRVVHVYGEHVESEEDVDPAYAGVLLAEFLGWPW